MKRVAFEPASTERLVPFALAHPVAGFPESLIRRLLGTLISGPGGVIELADADGTAALALVVDLARSAADCRVLDVIGARPDVSPVNALQHAVRHAEPFIAAGPRAGLDVPLSPRLAGAAAFLTGRGYALSHTEHEMTAAQVSVPPSAPLPASWTWSPVTAATLDSYYDAVMAAMVGVPSFYASPRDAFRASNLAAPEPDELLLHDGRVAGFVSVRMQPGDRGRVSLIGRHPEHRARGLGPRLLARAVGTLAARGATRWELDVAATNERALGLYRACGFEVVHSTPVYRRTGLGQPPIGVHSSTSEPSGHRT